MSQPYNPPPRPTTRVGPVLVAVWAALSASAGAFVLAFGTNSPAVDEWEFVPVVTGHEPAGPWLFARHNEHRFPLPRALYITIVRLTHDYRAASLFQVVCLSGLSRWLMRVAAGVRGRPAWADLFVPLSLLHVGHWENLLQGYQIVFTLYTVVVGAVGVVAVRATPATRFRSGVTAGGLAGLLVLCGGSGVIVGVPVGLWVVWLAVAEWRAGKGGRAATLFLVASMPLGYAGWYLGTYERPPQHPPASASPHPIRGVAMVTGEALAMAVGPGFGAGWPAVAAGVLVVAGVTVAGAARSHSAGVAAVVAGVLAVALATGVGRAGFGDQMGLWARYALLTWPLPGVAYLFGVREHARWLPVGLCVTAALAFPANTAVGIGTGVGIREVLAGVEADARAGVPPERIVERFAETMQDGQEERGVVGIPMLRDGGIGAYAGKGRFDGLWWIAVAPFGLAAAVLAGRWLGRRGRAAEVTRARERLRLDGDRLAAELLTAAAATGKPRGLRWVGCAATGDPVLARDRATGGLVGLVPVEVRFEPVEGSDMADNPAAREPRPATAVFTYAGGQWHTDGRVVFNLDPVRALGHFGNSLIIVPDKALARR